MALEYYERSRPLRRAQSVSMLPRYSSPSVTRASSQAAINALRRVASAQDLRAEVPRLSAKYQPRGLVYYNRLRDWDLWDEYWWDRYYYLSPLYAPFSIYNRSRYHYVDPYGYSWGRAGRSYWSDYVSSLYWPSYRDYAYESPLSRSWAYQAADLSRATRMYKTGLINYDALEKYWLGPQYYEKKLSDYTNLYYPHVYSKPRRYFYSFD